MTLKLQAITVSVNYPDFLDFIAPNKRHFDRWLIVTDSNDEETIRVCEKHELDYIFSKRLYENGGVFNKANALNEGLDHLRNDGWVAAIDSDIFLPGSFRQRLEAQELDPDSLYGLAARRVCLHHDEFRVLKEREPWRHAWKANFVIGYFHLFHFSQEFNRYVEDTSDDASTYDIVFSDLFDAEKKRKLPISCLHLGPARENWRGRKAKKFTERKTPVSDSGIQELVAAVAPQSHGGSAMAQVGYYPGHNTREFSAAFETVYLIDQWQIETRHHDHLVNLDRDVLQKEFELGTDGLANLRRCGGHSSTTIDKFDDSSLDAIYFDGELEYDYLLVALPHWLPKLKPGGHICGSYFGHPFWPESTFAICLLLGTPQLVLGDSSWAIHLPGGAGPQAAPNRYPLPLPISGDNAETHLRSEKQDRGVVFVTNSAAETESLIISLHSLRKSWLGAVCVIETSIETPSLRISCARYGAEYLNIGDKAENDIFLECQKLDVPFVGTEPIPLAKALRHSPYSRSLYLACSALVVRPLDVLFDLLDESPLVLAPTGDKPEDKLLRKASENWRRAGLLVEGADNSLASSASASLEVFAFRCDSPLFNTWAELAIHGAECGLPMPDEIGLWKAMSDHDTLQFPPDWIRPPRQPTSEDTRIATVDVEQLHEEDDEVYVIWADHEQEVIRAMASEIRVPESVTIVTFVHQGNIDTFYRNWNAWRFPNSVEVKVLSYEIDREDLFFVDSPNAQLSPISSQDKQLDIGDVREVAFANEVSSLVKSAHWICLDPDWFPLPGAELFKHEDWQGFDLVSHQIQEPDDPPARQEDPRLKDLEFALVRTDCVEKFLPVPGSERGDGLKTAFCDASVMGWKNSNHPPSSGSAKSDE